MPMHAATGGFLLDDKGARISIDAFFGAEELGCGSGARKVDDAINLRGFVLMTLAHRAAVVELCPLTVAPLAALEAFHLAKETAAECVLLVLRGDTWRRSEYEFFSSVEAAARRIKSIARAASKRAAAKLRTQSSATLEPKLASVRTTSVSRQANETVMV